MTTHRPNIILILLDQLRADATGYVNPAIRTPNIDRLASEGVTFRRCYTNAPLCVPARTSLITGQHVNEHAVWSNSIVPDRHGPSHVRNIRDTGYHTVVIGKTHLCEYARDIHTDSLLPALRDWGYAESLETGGALTPVYFNSPYTDYLAEKGLLAIHLSLIHI